MKSEHQPEPKENDPDQVVTVEQLRNLRLLLAELVQHVDLAIPQVQKESGQVKTNNWKTGFRASLHILQFVEGLIGKVHTNAARRYHDAIRDEQDRKSRSPVREKDLQTVEDMRNKTKQHRQKPKD